MKIGHMLADIGEALGANPIMYLRIRTFLEDVQDREDSKAIFDAFALVHEVCGKVG
jgi:hypothetical protein